MLTVHTAFSADEDGSIDPEACDDTVYYSGIALGVLHVVFFAWGVFLRLKGSNAGRPQGGCLAPAVRLAAHSPPNVKVAAARALPKSHGDLVTMPTGCCDGAFARDGVETRLV